MWIYFLTADWQLGNEKHWTSTFFQNTELTTYHCIIMRILKKLIKLNKQSINLTWYAMWIDFRNKNMSYEIKVNE